MDSEFHGRQRGAVAFSCKLRILPTELLTEIFLLCLPSVPSFSPKCAPLLLTHVCSWWREHAINQSALWDTLYLPSPLEGFSQGFPELFSLWLQRSRTRPLSVDFHLASDYQPWKIDETHIATVHEVVKRLAPHAPRIIKLLRIFPRFLFSDLRLENMYILDDLFICDTTDLRIGRTHVPQRYFQVSRSLRCLSLRQTFFDLRAFSSLQRLAHLDLWQLQGEGQMSLRSCFTVLQHLTWLESCTLDVAFGDSSMNFPGEIKMQNLSFLFISWDWLVDIGPLLDSLFTPNLRRLGLRGPPPTRRHWPHLRRYLRRCRVSLSQLSIKEIGFTDIQLLQCLQLCPTLTNLSISHCSVDSSFIRSLRLDRRAPAHSNILPCLEYLSLEACDDFDVKDLISMLNTRGKALPPGGCRLRGIRLSFCRRIQEIHRLDIENSGIENVIIKVARPAARQQPR